MRNKNTLFIGKVLLRFPALDSTNRYALDLLSKSEPVEGTVILTYNQYKGRGQMGNTWESEPGRNIAFSLILYPRFVAIRRQFLLNQAMALAVADCLANYLEKPVKIKWPNDIYVEGGKISGMLIQNTLGGSLIQSSVTGIGINVNQVDFSPELPNAVSLRLLTGREHDLDELSEVLCHHLEARYLQLKQGGSDAIGSDYISRLYRYGEWISLRRAEGEVFSGRITGVTGQGLLIVEKEDGSVESFDLKTIIYR